MPASAIWRGRRKRQRDALESLVTERGPFDVIDTPATTASQRLARAGCLVARNVQPELDYLTSHLIAGLRQFSPRLPLNCACALVAAVAVVAGWRRAHLILCLGSHDLMAMRRRFPFWTGKLTSYDSAPPDAERRALAVVRRQRAHFPVGDGIRFLWLGRWAAHKGIDRLRLFIAERSASFAADTFTLAGCGPHAGRDLPVEWLRSGRVRLLPAYSRGELPALLASHDAGLFTSVHEGWGLSLNEMLESGMPVFATPVGAVPDLLPYFPRSLRPFPPPPEAALEIRPLEDLEANGYLQRFCWPEIARRYEEAVLGRGVVAAAGDGGSGR